MHLPNWASSHLEFKPISPTDLLLFLSKKKCKLASFQFKPFRGPAIYSARIPSTALFRANSQRHFWIALSKSVLKQLSSLLFIKVSQKKKRNLKKKISQMKGFFILFALFASIAAGTASEYHLEDLRARKYNSVNFIRRPTPQQMRNIKQRRLSVLRWI